MTTAHRGRSVRTMRVQLAIVVALTLFVREAPAQEADKPADKSTASTAISICLLIESAAAANDLPLEFFTRLIWQESSFRPDAVGPMTRSGGRAQGIAQFMPCTAAERG